MSALSVNSAAVVPFAATVIPSTFPMTSLAANFLLLPLVSPSPFNRYVSLNFVVSDTRSISVTNWSISSWIFWRSSWDIVPFPACTANSFILCNIEWTSVSAPSAVCTQEIPSCALEEAWSRPRICFLIFSEIESPAASSAARLIL